MPTLTERIEDLMSHTGWEVPKVAEIAGVSKSAVHQWLGHGSKTIHSIGNIEAAQRLEAMSGLSALWLAKGKGPRLVESPVSASPKDMAVELSSNKLSHVGHNGLPLVQPKVMFHATNVANTFRLLGNLLRAQDDINRDLFASLIVRLIKTPEDQELIAQRAANIAEQSGPPRSQDPPTTGLGPFGKH